MPAEERVREMWHRGASIETVAEAIRAAVAEERELVARMIEGWPFLPDGSDGYGSCCVSLANEIAEKIRGSAVPHEESK